MNKSFKRSDRVAETIQRKLAQIIQQGVKGLDLSAFITISAVNLTADLEHAKVYFTVFNGDIKETSSKLNNASGYLRSILSKSMTLRSVPELQFVYDESIEYAKHLTQLINNSTSENEDDSIDE